MSLLSAAQAVPVRGRPPADAPGDLETVLAYLRGEVRPSQIAAALGRAPSYIATWTVRVLMTAIADGSVIITPRKAPK